MSDEDFPVSFARAHAFGVIAGVRMPEKNIPVPETALARLHPDEQAFARTLAGFRQIEWTGARLAWHAARERLGIASVPLLSSKERVPLAPSGWAISVTHKRDLALVLVGNASDGDLGVDLEDDLRAATAVAEKVLVPEELGAVHALPEGERPRAILTRFALKEAVYKAAFPLVRRTMRYAEACVDDRAQVNLRLDPAIAGAPFAFETALEWIEGTRLIAAVRCRRTTPPGV